MSRQFIKKGDKVIIKEDVPDVELNSKAVLDNIHNVIKRINNTHQSVQKIEQANLQLVGLKDEIAKNEEVLKSLQKFNDWATEVQLSKIKALLPKAVEDAKAKVEESYVFDKKLTEEQNVLQKYHQLVHYAGGSPEIREAISYTMIEAHIHSKTLIANPWL